MIAPTSRRYVEVATRALIRQRAAVGQEGGGPLSRGAQAQVLRQPLRLPLLLGAVVLLILQAWVQPLMRRSWPAHSCSRRANFWILPVEVFGSSSMNSIASGAL